LLERLARVRGGYEQLMLTRADHYYACDHPALPLAGGTVWVPSGEDYVPTAEALDALGLRRPGARRWHCVTERHAVLPMALAEPVLAVLPWLLSTPSFHAAVDRQGLWPNPECAVGSAWAAAGVWRRLRRYPRPMLTVRRVASEANNWRRVPQRCSGQIPPLLRAIAPRTVPKYCSEAAGARVGCRELRARNASQPWHGWQYGRRSTGDRADKT
jgi:hypothetical protein